MKTISHGQLYEKLLTGDPITVVEVLDQDAFRAFHLRRAINIPLSPSFESDVERVIPDKTEPIVVYCMDRSCPVSAEAAERLERHGYVSVTHYPGGKKDWLEAGLPVEGLGEVAHPS